MPPAQLSYRLPIANAGCNILSAVSHPAPGCHCHCGSSSAAPERRCDIGPSLAGAAGKGRGPGVRRDPSRCACVSMNNQGNHCCTTPFEAEGGGAPLACRAGTQPQLPGPLYCRLRLLLGPLASSPLVLSRCRMVSSSSGVTWRLRGRRQGGPRQGISSAARQPGAQARQRPRIRAAPQAAGPWPTLPPRSSSA